MSLLLQIKLALFDAPLSIRLIRLKSIQWAMIYCMAAVAIFGLFSWLMLANQQTIKESLLSYFFPQSWHEISEKLANFLFESQAKTVISNLILSGSLVMASIFLFPIKEKYSAIFEKEARFNNGETDEFPLIYQAWEEAKLFLLYLTAQSVILWFGYYPYQWSHWLSISLSYLFLFFTFGLDFISPTLQRHRTQYTVIIKLMFRKPLVPLLFGLLFSLPAILLSRVVFSYQQLTLIEISSILFLTNVIFLTLAVPAGTYVASRMFSSIDEMLPPRKRSVIWGYSIMSILLVLGLTLHSRLIMSLHHKSQLLKAEYSLDWSSIEYEVPSFSELAEGQAFSQLSFDMVVDNPTEFDIEIETSQLFIEQKQTVIATIDLTGFELPAGESRRITMKLDSNSDLSNVSNFANILDGWRVDMHLQVSPGIPLIINVVSP